MSKINIVDSMYYWLGKRRPFVINGEYELRLLFIDKVNLSAKIEITNLKTQEKEIIEEKIGEVAEVSNG